MGVGVQNIYQLEQVLLAPQLSTSDVHCLDPEQEMQIRCSPKNRQKCKTL